MVGATGIEPVTPAVWRQFFLPGLTLNQPLTHTDPARMWLIVTPMDWSGHIPVTFWSQWSRRKRNSIWAIPSIRDSSGTIHSPFKVIEGITHIKVGKGSSVSRPWRVRWSTFFHLTVSYGFLLLLVLIGEYSGGMRQQISRLAVCLFLAISASLSQALNFQNEWVATNHEAGSSNFTGRANWSPSYER